MILPNIYILKFCNYIKFSARRLYKIYTISLYIIYLLYNAQHSMKRLTIVKKYYYILCVFKQIKTWNIVTCRWRYSIFIVGRPHCLPIPFSLSSSPSLFPFSFNRLLFFYLMRTTLHFTIYNSSLLFLLSVLYFRWLLFLCYKNVINK